MSYVSLYRKYRSQTFAEVIGQEHVTRTLSQAVAEDRVHHAYLFTGPRGTGKTSTARILAKSLNCEQGPTPDPCNVCTQCVAITTGSSVDVIEIDAASHGGVDDIRDLRDRVTFAPVSARMKVYIVDECHMLSTAGWNAFLKTVEEPPGHVVFVFATTEPHKVLDTILSRTQRFDFRRIDAAALAGHVAALGAEEDYSFEAGAIDLIVRAGDGSARDTLSVLDQVVAFTGPAVTLAGVAEVLGAVPDELLVEATEAIAAGDVPALCTLVQRLADGGHDLRQFASDAVNHLRALFLLQVAPGEGLVETTAERLGRLTTQAAALGRIELLRAIELLADAQAQMRRGNTRLPLEIALVKAALPEATGDPAALAARMDRLERRTGVAAEPAGGATDPSPATGRSPARPSPASAPPPSPTAGWAPASAAEASATDGTAGSIAEAVPESSTDAPDAPPAPADARDVAPTPADATERETKTQPEPEQTPGSPAQAAQPDITLVHRSWPAVLDAVKRRSMRLNAFLLPAQAVALEGSTVVLRFGPNSAWHAEQCASEEWRDRLTEALQTVLGPEMRYRVVVGDHDAPPEPSDDRAGDQTEQVQAEEVAETEAAEAAGVLPSEEEATAAALETLRRDLGATVVDDGG